MADFRRPDNFLFRRAIYCYRGLICALTGLLVLFACSSPAPEWKQLQKEVKALKAAVAKQNERLEQLQAGQQKVLALLETRPPERKSGRLAGIPLNLKPTGPQEIITVNQLLKQKDRYLETRVTVRGRLCPVLIPRNVFLLQGLGGEITVFFGDLPDKAALHRLTTQAWQGQVAVTGIFSGSSRARGGYQIHADAVKFL